MYDISQQKRLGPTGKLAPEAMTGFQALDKAALAEGAIPKKYTELMATAVALTTQCPTALDVHSKVAVAAGVSQAELAETVLVATALRAGAAVTHGSHHFPE